jgi:hypothetical protein
MVELVDTQDLKSCDLKSRAGSIPALSTKTCKVYAPCVFFCLKFFSNSQKGRNGGSMPKVVEQVLKI